MKSVKRGRGPSFMGGVAAVAAALFGVFWIVMAVSMGAWFMAPFGLIFVGVAVFNAIYNFKNATGKNRYSEFDITDENEEPDPFNERFGRKDDYDYTEKKSFSQSNDSRYCPYCGNPVSKDFEYCNICGKKLP